MAAGSSITVNGGAISVGGKHFTSSNQECCKPTGAYGLIKMQEGSSIMLNNGAKLYAWGYITGDGSITANSGANVYEYYQVTDWRGGTQTGNMANNKQKVFPFTQYYVQNIEAALTLNAGANEYTYISVTANIVGTKSATIPFVGSNGLFKLGADGQFTKRYIPAQDRMVFTISGEASLNTYEFIGWEPELEFATEDATYTAKFNEVPRKYTKCFGRIVCVHCFDLQFDKKISPVIVLLCAVQ